MNRNKNSITRNWLNKSRNWRS